jgi:hypothetical protein
MVNWPPASCAALAPAQPGARAAGGGVRRRAAPAAGRRQPVARRPAGRADRAHRAGAHRPARRRERQPQLPERCLQEVREHVARDDREITDGYERQAVITSGGLRAGRAGLWADSDALLKANLAQEPLALLPDEPAGQQRPQAGPQGRGAALVRRRPSTRARARPRGCSGARATCGRWWTWRRRTTARIEKTARRPAAARAAARFSLPQAVLANPDKPARVSSLQRSA